MDYKNQDILHFLQQHAIADRISFQSDSPAKFVSFLICLNPLLH